ncbi:hypothetical protein VTN77DRAFT_7341 [Rasamsonia byssochlamydoides]|uniref:uncharacterized protein n=1 Tax=Rasamsonia byssochlamydoides TaxID=89139 RepID=UPI0037426393
MGPDQIGPSTAPKRTISDKFRRIIKTFTTKDGLVGDYDYGFLFRPNLPFMKDARRSAPFFGLNDNIPVVLALLLGLQHALAMLAGVITPPILLSGSSGANFDNELSQYLVSTSLIVSGILSAIQITRIHIYKTPYYIGTGLISVVGTSFTTITIATGALDQMYSTGYCPVDDHGTRLPCPHGYGAILGTSCLCALLEIGLSFTSIKVLKRVFPPLVTGPTVLLIGVSLIQTGLQDWAGGSGCVTTDPSARALCPGPQHTLPWGSAQFIGLGFLVFLTIILCERFGSPIMKSCSVVIGLLIGCIVAAATGYFDRSGIDAAPVASFVWLHTFPLKIYAPLILPFLALYIVLMMESIGDITATCDVSRLDVQGDLFDSRIRGGVLADGLNSLLSGLCTITPMSTFAQNNGVIALTRCANRKAGYCCCFFLIVMGIFSKFAAALVAIPSSVLGGMTTFLFSSVAISGLRIISTVPFTRRNRFILTASFAVGMGATLVPDWFSYVFTYSGDNKGLIGLIDAIELVMSTGFVVSGWLALILNLILEEDEADDEAVLTTEADAREWGQIRHRATDTDLETGAKAKD